MAGSSRLALAVREEAQLAAREPEAGCRVSGARASILPLGKLGIVREHWDQCSVFSPWKCNVSSFIPSFIYFQKHSSLLLREAHGGVFPALLLLVPGTAYRVVLN